MFCSHCGAVIPDGSQFCPQCGGSCAEPQAPVAQPEVNVNDPQNIAKRTRDLKRLCAVLWIVIGILLCLTCVGIVAGIWNIIYGAKALKFADTIQAGNRSVYAAFDADLNSLTVALAVRWRS